jgi:ATP-binding cassette, subfamily B, bacterial
MLKELSMILLEKLRALLDIKAYQSLYTYTRGYHIPILWITLLKITLSFISVGTAIATMSVIDEAIDMNYRVAVLSGLGLLLLIGSQLILEAIVSHSSIRVSTKLRNQMILDFMEQIYKKDWLTISKYNSGDLSTRIYDDIPRIVNSAMESLSDILALGLQMLLGFVFILFFDPVLAILVFTLTPIAIIISILIGTKLRDIQSLIQDTESELRSKTNESIVNLTILKAFNFTHSNKQDIQGIQEERFRLIKLRNAIRIKTNLFMDIGYYLGFFLAIALGAYRLSTGAITVGMITALIQLVGRIQGPLEELSYEIPNLVSSFSSLTRIDEIYRVDNEEGDEELTTTLTLERILVRNIDFEYTPGVPILKHLQFEIVKGSRIGIIGSSGEGKTTLLNILLALIKPQSGDIVLTFDNGESDFMSAKYRRYFSYVTQKNMLFTGTIRDNFFLSRFVTEDAIHKALDTACATEFIQELPQGLDTPLLEEGLGLSQGQLQRLSIARALIHNRPILVLDEATSSLDVETELALIHNIQHNYPAITLIAVTHKQPLLDICDSTYKLCDAQIKKLS